MCVWMHNTLLCVTLNIREQKSPSAAPVLSTLPNSSAKRMQSTIWTFLYFFIIIFFSFISATRTGTGPTAELNARSGADCKLSTNLASRCLIMDTVSQKSLNGINENCGRPLCPFAKDDYQCIFVVIIRLEHPQICMTILGAKSIPNLFQ